MRGDRSILTIGNDGVFRVWSIGALPITQCSAVGRITQLSSFGSMLSESTEPGSLDLRIEENGNCKTFEVDGNASLWLPQVFSGDGRRLVSVSDSGLVSTIDTETAELVASIDDFVSSNPAAVISPGGDVLLVARDAETDLFLREASSSTPPRRLESICSSDPFPRIHAPRFAERWRGPFAPFGFGADGRSAWRICNKTVHVWRVGEPVNGGSEALWFSVQVGRSVTYFDYHAASGRYAAARRDGTVEVGSNPFPGLAMLWTPISRPRTIATGVRRLNWVRFVLQGRFLVAASRSGWGVWSLEDDEPRLIARRLVPLHAFAVHEDQMRLLHVDGRVSTHPFSFESMRFRLRQRTTACLPVTISQTLLGESPEKAIARWRACERSHGREPSE
jgi:hypothetical protein